MYRMFEEKIGFDWYPFCFLNHTLYRDWAATSSPRDKAFMQSASCCRSMSSGVGAASMMLLHDVKVAIRKWSSIGDVFVAQMLRALPLSPIAPWNFPFARGDKNTEVARTAPALWPGIGLGVNCIIVSIQKRNSEDNTWNSHSIFVSSEVVNVPLNPIKSRDAIVY